MNRAVVKEHNQNTKIPAQSKSTFKLLVGFAHNLLLKLLPNLSPEVKSEFVGLIGLLTIA